MTRLTVYLSEQEWAALQAMAESQMRGLREQARYLIVKALAESKPAKHDDLAGDKTPCPEVGA